MIKVLLHLVNIKLPVCFKTVGAQPSTWGTDTVYGYVSVGFVGFGTAVVWDIGGRGVTCHKERIRVAEIAFWIVGTLPNKLVEGIFIKGLILAKAPKTCMGEDKTFAVYGDILIHWEAFKKLDKIHAVGFGEGDKFAER